MKNLDLRQLRYFVAVAEELHFGRAALRLHLSQPPLSQQIAALEADLGVKLFIRSRRKVEITPAGTTLLEEARRILDAVPQAVTRVRSAATGARGLLKIGLNYSAPLNPVLARILSRFRKQHPDIALEFHENTSAKQLDGLFSKQLAACFIWPTRDDVSRLVSLQAITHEPLRLVMRRDHVLARKKTVSLAELTAYPLQISVRQTRLEFFDHLVDACQGSGLEPLINTSIIQLPIIMNAVAANDGVAFLPDGFRRFAPAEVIFKQSALLDQWGAVMSFALATRAKETNPLVKEFIKALNLNSG
jgi:DNA-binding transcriptional LysR family regulator